MIGCSHEGMWLGLLYSPSADRDEVILSAWASAGGRPLTVAGRLDDAPDMARALAQRRPRMRVGGAPALRRVLHAARPAAALMVFCVIHLDDAPCRDADEEVYVIVPDGSKTAIAVPLDALPRFLPLLQRAFGRCAAARVLDLRDADADVRLIETISRAATRVVNMYRCPR